MSSSNIPSSGDTPESSSARGSQEEFRLDDGTTPRQPENPFAGARFPFVIGPSGNTPDGSVPASGGAQQPQPQGRQQVGKDSHYHDDSDSTPGMSPTDRLWLSSWLADLELEAAPGVAQALDRYGHSRNGLRTEVQRCRDEGMRLLRDWAESAATQIFQEKDPGIIPYAAKMIFQDVIKEQQLPALKRGKGSGSKYWDNMSETSEEKDDDKVKPANVDHPGPFTKPQSNIQKLMTLGWSKDFHPGNNKAYQALLGQIGNIFPQFPPGLTCRTQPEAWENFWEQFDGQ